MDRLASWLTASCNVVTGSCDHAEDSTLETSGYADLDAVEADGWTYYVGGTGAATILWELIPTPSLLTSTKVLRITVDGPYTLGDVYAIQKLVPGFIPGKRYLVVHRQYENQANPWGPPFQWNPVAGYDIAADEDGKVLVSLGFVATATGSASGKQIANDAITITCADGVPFWADAREPNLMAAEFLYPALVRVDGPDGLTFTDDLMRGGVPAVHIPGLTSLHAFTANFLHGVAAAEIGIVFRRLSGSGLWSFGTDETSWTPEAISERAGSSLARSLAVTSAPYIGHDFQFYWIQATGQQWSAWTNDRLARAFTQSPNTVAFRAAGPASNLLLGTTANADGTVLTGMDLDVLEFVAFDAELSSRERQEVQDRLIYRWHTLPDVFGGVPEMFGGFTP